MRTLVLSYCTQSKTQVTVLIERLVSGLPYNFKSTEAEKTI